MTQASELTFMKIFGLLDLQLGVGQGDCISCGSFNLLMLIHILGLDLIPRPTWDLARLKYKFKAIRANVNSTELAPSFSYADDLISVQKKYRKYNKRFTSGFYDPRIIDAYNTVCRIMEKI